MSSEAANILVEASRRLFGDLCAMPALIDAERQWPAAMWDAIAAEGYPAALLPEAKGGAGLSVGEGFALLRSAGEFGLPLPLAETMLAGWLLSQAGFEVPRAPLAMAVMTDERELSLRKKGERWLLEGTARRVPGARHASHVVLCVPAAERCRIVVAPIESCRLRPDKNLAGEPRDDLDLDLELSTGDVAELGYSSLQLRALGAAARCCQMAGALDRTLETTVEYSKSRVQFGRPIGKFQAAQQSLAVLATQVAAAGAAADMAIAGLEDGLFVESVAAAKIRTGEAAGIAAAIAHQVHGAIGFTYEHSLHLFTKRLLSWCEEFGNERSWSRWLGNRILLGGGDALWPTIGAL